jgi:hypothetical protein
LGGNIKKKVAMLRNPASDQPKSLFAEDSRWLRLCLFSMFVLAALFRLDEIKAPGLLLDREYTSAIFARAYYFSNNPEVEDWRREIAILTKDQQPILEPPLVEYLVSLIYRAAGQEQIFLSRYLTNAFWLVGGIFMYLIAKNLLSVDDAVFATAYYLFVPAGVLTSRSFQPDSLMMMLFLLSLYLMISYFQHPEMRRLLLAALITGVTLLIRPLVLFGLFCAFLAISINRNGGLRKAINPHLILFGGISLLPAMMYYGYGIVFAGFMRWKIPTSFMPYLLAKKDFWLGWFNLGAWVTGYFPLIAAIIGFFVLRGRLVRYLVAGLAIGYLLFGVAFTYHIHTHGYYHIQLIAIVALCMAPLMVVIALSIKEAAGKRWPILFTVVLAMSLYFSHLIELDNLYQVRLEDPGVAREIGELVNHSARTVFVSYYYGVPLEYYGEFTGAPWPVRIEDPFYRRPGEKELSVQERLDGLGFVPEYFIITNFDLYRRKHQDLQAYLDANCSIHTKTERYLIYGSCQSTQTSHKDKSAGNPNRIN